VFPSWDAAYDHALDLGGDSGGVSVTARTATRPETPAARRALANAGRYSYVRSERDTEPPSAPDAADVEAFEAEIATYGEGQARLRNLARKSQGK
jgi:hypothetical protein